MKWKCRFPRLLSEIPISRSRNVVWESHFNLQLLGWFWSWWSNEYWPGMQHEGAGLQIQPGVGEEWKPWECGQRGCRKIVSRSEWSIGFYRKLKISDSRARDFQQSMLRTRKTILALFLHNGAKKEKKKLSGIKDSWNNHLALNSCSQEFRFQTPSAVLSLLVCLQVGNYLSLLC